MLRSLLAVLFIAYILQSIFAWFQLKRMYGTVDKVKQMHRGEPCHLVTGSGRQKFLVIKKGVFMILIVSFDGKIVDYYDMEGYSVFKTPKQNPAYIGLSLDELAECLNGKNRLAALRSAREQLGCLQQAVSIPQP